MWRFFRILRLNYSKVRGITVRLELKRNRIELDMVGVTAVRRYII